MLTYIKPYHVRKTKQFSKYIHDSETMRLFILKRYSANPSGIL